MYINMAKPVIIGANQESKLFKDKKNALVVKRSNPEALAGAILWAKEHRLELTKIAESGKKLYDDKFSNQVLANQLEKLLDTNTRVN